MCRLAVIGRQSVVSITCHENSVIFIKWNHKTKLNIFGSKQFALHCSCSNQKGYNTNFFLKYPNISDVTNRLNVY